MQIIPIFQKSITLNKWCLNDTLCLLFLFHLLGTFSSIKFYFEWHSTSIVPSKLVLLNSCYPWTDRIHSLSFIWFTASLFTNTYAKTIPVGDVVYVRDNTIAKDKFKKIYNEKGKD